MSQFGKHQLDFGSVTYYVTYLQHVGGEVVFCSAVPYTTENA